VEVRPDAGESNDANGTCGMMVITVVIRDISGGKAMTVRPELDSRKRPEIFPLPQPPCLPLGPSILPVSGYFGRFSRC
jgi:hypothetical protein